MQKAPRLHQRVGARVVIPFVVLTLVIAVMTSFLSSQLVASSLNERFANRLVEVSRSSNDGVVAVENTQLQQLRAMLYTDGVAQAALAQDPGALASLLTPLATNDGATDVIVLGPTHAPILYLTASPQINGSGLSYGTTTPTPAALPTWPFVNSVTQGVADQYGDKQVGIGDGSRGSTFYVAGPLDVGNQQVGSLLLGIPLNQVVESLAGTALADVTIYTSNGAPLATSFAASTSSLPDLPAPLSASVIQAGNSAIQMQSTINQRPYSVLLSPLILRHQVVGIISVALSSDFLMSANDQTKQSMAEIALLGVIFVLALGNLVTRSITRPLAGLVKTADRIGRGDLHARTGMQRRDELGLLARTLDSMAANVQRSHADLETRNHQLYWLHELSRVLARCQDEQSMGMSIVEHLRPATAAMGSWLWLPRQERDGLRLAAADGLDGGAHLPSGGSDEEALREALSQGAVLLETDEARRFLGDPLEFAEGSVLLLIGVASPTGDRGVIGLARRQPFAEGELTWIRQMCEESLVFLQNAQLAREQRERLRQLSALQEVGTVVSSTLEPADVFQRVVTETARVFNATHVGLMLTDPSSGELVVQEAIGFDHDPTRMLTLLQSHGSAPTDLSTALAKRTRETLRVVGNQGDIDIMWAPIRVNDRESGVLAVMRQAQDEGFGSADLSVLTTLSTQAASAIRNSELHQDLHALFMTTVEALANAIDAKDSYTHGHSTRVAKYAMAIAHAYGIDGEQLHALQVGALLHDVGKIGIPDDILGKPGALTEEERLTILSHTIIGGDILNPIHLPAGVLDTVIYHHERFDGKGYPDGLAGEAIPLFARIVSVADVFDAMTSDRSYRAGMPWTKACAIIEEIAGTQLDPELAGIFLCYIRKLRDQSVITAA